MGSFGITQYEGEQLFDFTPALFELDIILLATKPGRMTPVMNLIRPFPPLVWLLVIMTLVLACLTFLTLSLLHDILTFYPGKQRSTKQRWEEACFIALGCLCSQGTHLGNG